MAYIADYSVAMFKININRIVDSVKHAISTLEVSVKEPLDVWLNGTKNG